MFLLLSLLISAIEPSFSKCHDSYMTFCDCVTDLNNQKVQKWTEMVIGSEENINNCYSTTITSHSLDNLNEIKLLFIVNQVNNIEPNAFENVGETLEFLKFYHNNLTRIKTGTFTGFQKLNRLSLVHNNIEVLEEFSFQDSKITNLDLSNNKIHTLVLYTFRNTKITSIDFRNNELTYINPDGFNGELEVLHLDYNKMTFIGDLSQISKLKELTISHNRLTDIIDISSLEHVKKLDFSFNGIGYVDSKQLKGFKNLEVLDFSNNKLETFSLKALKKIKTKVTLLLSYNLLTKLEIETSTPMTLTLFGNPWNCDCLETMEKAMDHSNVSRTRCDLKLFGAGNMPICLNQGDDGSLNQSLNKFQRNKNLRSFLITVRMNRTNLSCDLFHDFDV